MLILSGHFLLTLSVYSSHLSESLWIWIFKQGKWQTEWTELDIFLTETNFLLVTGGDSQGLCWRCSVMYLDKFWISLLNKNDPRQPRKNKTIFVRIIHNNNNRGTARFAEGGWAVWLPSSYTCHTAGSAGSISTQCIPRSFISPVSLLHGRPCKSRRLLQGSYKREVFWGEGGIIFFSPCLWGTTGLKNAAILYSLHLLRSGMNFDSFGFHRKG